MTTIQDNAFDGLAHAAVTIAARGAARWLAAHPEAGTVDDATLVKYVREAVRRALPGALRDAKEAIEARMPEAAEQTFGASMVLAGIEAARVAVQSRGEVGSGCEVKAGA